MTSSPLIIGTRGSPLALAQAHLVARAVEEAQGWAAGTVAIRTVTTSGDRIQDRPLADIGGKALWTKELDRALLAGETDCSVHSMKDVEAIRPDALRIAAMLPRADVQDRLIGAASVAALARGATVGTSSPRRAAQLKQRRPDLNTVPIRGNVDTRLAKLAAGEVDATLLAAAGLDRLGRGTTGVAIDLLPAPGQGAIGIECRAGDGRVETLLAAIDHHPTHVAVAAERAFVRALGGSCHSPVAAQATVKDEMLTFRCELLSEDGRCHIYREAWFAAGDLDGPADLGRAMLAEAPDAVQALFTG
ncbi:hydroxymethylbilane synthase [Sphingomonas xanthus]|uniref:Porphobilinogen deaminase n=1 Tax=Sphingomonas xanthus TaxID=2594473 RepID=A0A516IRJ5_9SPHN|nr:hydroxymethylbilane synthase [Sphingomonas xanthus]QDP19522.1 hydroxymethylbilane synthase [Sphingomonas xanthus]